MYAVTATSLSIAWLEAMEYLVTEPKGKAVNVAVAFTTLDEDPRIRAVVDGTLAALDERAPKEKIYPVDTVASTLFPQTWYHPDRCDDARERLYRCQQHAARVHRRLTGEDETYFDRLVAYPGTDGAVVNQLEEQVLRLRGQLKGAAPKSSAYEIGVSHEADIRVNLPGRDRKYLGFPCLSHISLSLHDGAIHLTALYRNQGFLRKAYGNYVGLARLTRFFATEVGVRYGEVMCVASHADAEIGAAGGTAALRRMINECREALGAPGLQREVNHVA